MSEAPFSIVRASRALRLLVRLRLLPRPCPPSSSPVRDLPLWNPSTSSLEASSPDPTSCSDSFCLHSYSHSCSQVARSAFSCSMHSWMCALLALTCWPACLAWLAASSSRSISRSILPAALCIRPSRAKDRLIFPEAEDFCPFPPPCTLDVLILIHLLLIQKFHFHFIHLPRHHFALLHFRQSFL